MTIATYRQLTKADAGEVQAVALAAWKYTYDRIFDLPFIERFFSPIIPQKD